MTRFISRAGQELPAEFSPPEKAAEHIALLNTIADREAYWLRIPSEWHAMIGVLVVPAIARRIADMPQKFDRQNALASVPELWHGQVKALVMSYWKTRQRMAAASREVAA